MFAGRSLPVIAAALVLAVAPSLRAEPWDQPLRLGKSDGSFMVSLRGGTGTRTSGSAETVAMIELTVPLDRFVAPRVIAEGGSAPVRQPSPPAARDPGVVRAPVDARLARRAVHVALVVAGYGATGRRLDSLSARARSSATLPEVRLRAARSTDETLRLAPTTTDPYRYTQAGGASLWFEARLSWRLDRLVFAKEELAVERLRRERDQARMALVQKVLAALFTWQRAELRRADPELPPEERALAAVDALEAELTLDVLTDGWFGAEIAKMHNGDAP